ncbi:MAG: hypothetical protein DRJ11_10685 [Candidatus Aminicenantes bacterium]|nr:MAG: hypothetical protein DRJ11_10685 [Candidatus Aminicenantes bacterium]
MFSSKNYFLSFHNLGKDETMKKAISVMFLSFLPLFLASQQVEEVTPPEVYQILQQKKAPNVYLIDVRCVAVYYFMGHPEGAYNIPLRFWGKRAQKLIFNEHFIDDPKNRLAHRKNEN